MKLSTIPGRLPLSFRELNSGIDWKTKESPIGGQAAEKAWDWRHLVLIDGVETNYGAPYHSSGGVSGELNVDLYAYGNLGTSKILIDVSALKLQAARQIACTGLTEQEMLNAADIKFSEQTNEWERVKHNVKVITTLASAGFGLGALVLLAIGSTVAAIAGIIAAVVGVVAFVVVFLVDWLSVSSFAKAIIDNYPKANT